MVVGVVEVVVVGLVEEVVEVGVVDVEVVVGARVGVGLLLSHVQK